ncbi:hypothetical protein HY992_06505 [Candidatus Micrarchaeota archaeon]|nr:hypothetical protein [Candidatus Micrarchaeota archaeon]
MHEYAVASKVLSELVAEARKHKAKKLVGAKIRLARDLTDHVSPEAFQSLLSQLLLATDSFVKNAKFKVEKDEKGELKEGQFCILEIDVE